MLSPITALLLRQLLLGQPLDVSLVEFAPRG
jgi:hypothetical protein